MKALIFLLFFSSGVSWAESDSPNTILAKSKFDSPIKWAGELVDSEVKKNGDKTSIYWLARHHYEEAELIERPFRLSKKSDGYFVIHLVVEADLDTASELADQTTNTGSYAVVTGKALTKVKFKGREAVAIETGHMEITSEIEI